MPAEAEARVEKLIVKLCKKHANETIAVVIPEPLASLIAAKLKETDLGDLWKSECDNGSWEVIDSETHDTIGAHLVPACKTGSSADTPRSADPFFVQ